MWAEFTSPTRRHPNIVRQINSNNDNNSDDSDLVYSEENSTMHRDTDTEVNNNLAVNENEQRTAAAAIADGDADNNAVCERDVILPQHKELSASDTITIIVSGRISSCPVR